MTNDESGIGINDAIRMTKGAFMQQRIECVNPILNVGDMGRSLGFYVGLMGFENVSWGNERFTQVLRDGCGIYLSLSAQKPSKAWVWIGVEDARALHDQLAGGGARIVKKLTKEAWALEFEVEDPDGNVLRIGSDPEDGTP